MPAYTYPAARQSTKPSKEGAEKPAANVHKRGSPEKEMARARALRSEKLLAFDNKQPEERPHAEGCECPECDY